MANAAYDAIIVDAGHNGLVAAFYLARAGRRVLLCERRPFVGGAVARPSIRTRSKPPPRFVIQARRWYTRARQAQRRRSGSR